MLNLTPVFDDAIIAFESFASHLTTTPLPATVFMMQRDVINHYRYALTHYLPLTLNEHFLQNSSIGTPYEKWAKFTNEDFDMFSFAVHNLLRYTSRLIYETERTGLQEARRFSEMHDRGDKYSDLIFLMTAYETKMGLRVEPSNVLIRTPCAIGSLCEGSVQFRSESNERPYELTTIDPEENETTEAISLVELLNLTRTFGEMRFDISDRAIIESLKNEGLAEVESLTELNVAFGKLCSKYYSQYRLTTAYDSMNESWWV